MPGIPDNSAGSSHCRQRDEDQACAPPSGPGAPSPDSQAAYTQAIRPLYPTFFENALAFGGSPYTLLGGNGPPRWWLADIDFELPLFKMNGDAAFILHQ